MSEEIDYDWTRFLAKRVTNELTYLMNKYKLKSVCLEKFPKQAYYIVTRGYYLKLYDKKRYIQILEAWFQYYCVPEKKERTDDDVQMSNL